MPPPWEAGGLSRYLRWAWLVVGGTQYFAGQVPLFRIAVQTRMRNAKQTKFPPKVRDAVTLGGTIFDLLDRHRGPDACALLVSRIRRDGAERAIEIAFGERAREVEREWRRYLREDVTRAGGLPGELEELHW